MTRLARWIRLGLVAELLTVGTYAVVVVHAQDVTVLERRVNDIDKDLSGRIRVLESDMIELKWLARGVAIAIIGQLVLAAFTLKERKP